MTAEKYFNCSAGVGNEAKRYKSGKGFKKNEYKFDFHLCIFASFPLHLTESLKITDFLNVKGQ